MQEEILRVTTALNNIKGNNYTVQDYKMCPAEAEICIKALEFYLKALKMDSLSVADIFKTLDKEIDELPISVSRKPQLFDLKK